MKETGGIVEGILHSGRFGHACIISGESAAIRREAAGTICEGLIGKSGFHADIIWVTHEKPASIGVDDIRSQVTDTVGIRPFSAERKIYIIDEAEKMTVQAQNALLKTIEEPPSYAVILLLVTHPEILLETVRSRCMSVKLQPGTWEEMLTALGDRYDLYASYLKQAFGTGRDAASLASGAEEIRRSGDMKEYLDLCTLWFRDVLVYKRTGDERLLAMKQETDFITDLSRRMSYPEIRRAVEAIDTASARLTANVTPELTLEMMMLHF